MLRVLSGLGLVLGLLLLGPSGAFAVESATSTVTGDSSPTTSAPSPTPPPESSFPSPSGSPVSPADSEVTTTGPPTSSPSPSEPESTELQEVVLSADQWGQVEVFMGSLLFFVALSTIAAFGSRKGPRS